MTTTRRISGLFMGAIALLATTASAGNTIWSPWFEIDYMDNNDGAQGISLKLTQTTVEFVNTPGGTQYNPAGCQNESNKREVVMRTTAPASARELMSKTLLSALLSRRKVRVQISGTDCIGNRPVFGEVAIK